MTDQSLPMAELSRSTSELVTDQPISVALCELVGVARTILGVHGAGVTLARDGRLVAVASAPDDVAALERLQDRTQAGPAVQACRTGLPVVIDDLGAAPRRWTTLGRAAASSGITSVAAIPLDLDDSCLGALTLYDTGGRHWSADDQHAAGRLATLAASYVVYSASLDDARRTTEQLQHALDSRVVIEQAKGILAGERNVSVETAFQMLRRYSRNNRVSLHLVARAVVRDGLRP